MSTVEAPDLYVSRFDQNSARRTAEPAWLAKSREAAMARFRVERFPTTRDEEFRFTNVAPIADRGFETGLPGGPAIESLLRAAGIPGLDAHRLVFVNGRVSPALSSAGVKHDGVRLMSLSEAVRTEGDLVEGSLGRAIKFETLGFTALNTALWDDGALVLVAPGAVVDRPIHLVHLTDASAPLMSHPRTLVVVGRHGQAHVIESYAGAAGQSYFTNALTEIVGGEASSIEYCRVQREGLEAFHVSSTHVHLSRAAVFASENIVLGGALVRNDVNAVLDAEGINCTLNGLYLVDGSRLVDNHTAIDHAKPHCESHELYKGILDDRGRGVFNGKIYVRQDAQKTDAKQTNQVLLLSDEATINTKPQLEIFADDVKCTHGATVGQLSAEQLFYLRARGIGEAQARAILLHAFASDIVERIQVEPLRNHLEQILLERLPI
jgi:Fe-S cluster assembly protein SufD